MPRTRTLNFQILGIDEIAEYFQELGAVPQKSVRKAAKSGATIIRNKVRSDIQLPVLYGWLRDGITIVEEKKKTGTRNRTGKAGFQVTFDRAFNEIFQKDITNKGIYGGTEETGYYPASMEYGFKHRAKGGGVTEIGGHHFLQIVGTREESNVQDKMIEVLSKDIDKIKTRNSQGGP